MNLVVDASGALKWLLPEEYSSEAINLLLTWIREDAEVLVPSWFHCEMSNALYQRTLSQTIGLQDAQDSLRDLLRFVTFRDVEPENAIAALAIATRFRLSATYDAQYLALAEHLDCDLWTADVRFWESTRATFPRVHWIGEIDLPENTAE